MASRQKTSDSPDGKLLRLSNASNHRLEAVIMASRSSRGVERSGALLGSIRVFRIFVVVLLALP